MIFHCTNVLYIPKLIELAKTVQDANHEALERMLVAGMGRKDSRLFVFEKEEKIKAFMFVTVEEVEGEDAAFIQFCVSIPDANERNVVNELLNRTRGWAGELGLRWIYFMTRRDPRAYARKYKFRHHKTIQRSQVSDARSLPEEKRYQFHTAVLRRGVD